MSTYAQTLKGLRRLREQLTKHPEQAPAPGELVSQCIALVETLKASDLHLSAHAFRQEYDERDTE